MTMPIMIKPEENYSVQCLWEEKFDYPLNLLTGGFKYQDKKLSLVTASEHGNVKTHSGIFKDQLCGFEKTGENYETKGGPIHAILSYNVMKFSSEDILVGDSNGIFTIITNGQILNRRSVCDGNITSIIIDNDSTGNMSIVMGSSDGTLVAVTPYEVLWKIRLSEVLKQDEQQSENSISITSIHRYCIQSSTGDTSYIIVADSEKRIHLFQNGRLVMTLNVPSVVTSMCSGYFLYEDVAAEVTNPGVASPVKGGQRYKGDEQVAMATKSGAIFILSNFHVLLYANLNYAVTNIKLLPATGSEDVDAILCSGHFNKLCILQNRVNVCSYKTNDWIHTFDTISSDSGSEFPLLVAGCLDGSLKLLKLMKTR